MKVADLIKQLQSCVEHSPKFADADVILNSETAARHIGAVYGVMNLIHPSTPETHAVAQYVMNLIAAAPPLPDRPCPYPDYNPDDPTTDLSLMQAIPTCPECGYDQVHYTSDANNNIISYQCPSCQYSSIRPCPHPTFTYVHQHDKPPRSISISITKEHQS